LKHKAHLSTRKQLHHETKTTKNAAPKNNVAQTIEKRMATEYQQCFSALALAVGNGIGTEAEKPDTCQRSDRVCNSS